jgi:uncharacterized repeat protein (TIGR01451 family)
VYDVGLGDTVTVLVTLEDEDTATVEVLSHETADAERVSICHREGNGSYHLIEISADAVEAHERHGDGHPGLDVPGTDGVLTFSEDCSVLGPQVDIEKSTNGEDADRGAGPRVAVGDPVEWTYVVTNTGNVDLTDIVMTDSEEGLVCEAETLLAGDSITCTLTGDALPGRYENIGTVTAIAGTDEVTDSDRSAYVGQDEEDDGEEDDDGAGSEKVALCHRTGNGQYRLIEVSVDAEPAHLAHGDGHPGDGEFDESCNVL